MKFMKFIASVLVIILALGISITAIYFAARDNQMSVSLTEPATFAAPVVVADIFTDGGNTDTTTQSLDFGGDIANYFTEATTEEITTEEVTTEEVTTEEVTTEPTTEALVFEPDLSTNYYNNKPFVTVGTDYFNDAVFIGNSRLQGFILYSKVPDLRSYTYVGLSVKTYFSKDAFTVDGQSLTAAQALESNLNFSKVYLKFGINELGWVSNEQFKEDYSSIIEHIYSCNPNAIVFIQSVLPVSQYAIERDPTLDNEKIQEYNNALMNIASEYGACYLDVASIFTGEDGYMPPDLAFDGIHLHVNSVQQWLNYLLGHGIEEN